METNSIEWVDFFKNSGLPEPAASKYAVIFSKHRIHFNMLKDLNKEILYDMGIRTIGDVIAILRHAKDVDEETTKVKILGKDPRRKTLNDTITNVSTAKSVESGLKRRLDDDSMQRGKVRKILPPKDSNDLETHEYMSSESTYVIKMPSILPGKVSNSVFKRLGAQEETVKQPIVQGNSSSVFSRLGTSQPIRVVNPIGTKSTSVLRGAEGASSRIFASSLPQRTVATVKPTNVLVRKSLADAKGLTATRSLAAQRMLAQRPATTQSQRTASSLQSFNHKTVGVKERLGTNSNLLTTNAAKKLIVTAPQTKRNTLSLKKSIFDRLGPMKL